MIIKNVFSVTVIVTVISIQAIGVNGKLPSTLKKCSRNDPDINGCIIKAVNIVRPLLATGDLGDGYHTPPLEPLLLDNIEMGRGRQFRATFSDIQARGGSDFIIDKLSANTSTIAFDVAITLPKISFIGKYSLRIKLLLLNIQGAGDMKGYFENAKADVQMRGSKYFKNGIEYVRFTKMPIRIKVSNMKLQLDNLFNGDKILGEVGNSIINDNQDLYLNEIIPGLEKGLSQKFLLIANEILETATYDEMFPPN
ncbi:protein takeout [Episyrphus balteatus]|uniref:protein takeout n=1 Tax=Episyrphus balteatus TaxID=286459 RepID=UPI0024850D1F|nr:protein takeout [Episyrphus balteatus]